MRQEWNNEATRSQAKEEGALIARLPVSVRVDGKALAGTCSGCEGRRHMACRTYPQYCI